MFGFNNILRSIISERLWNLKRIDGPLDKSDNFCFLKDNYVGPFSPTFLRNILRLILQNFLNFKEIQLLIGQTNLLSQLEAGLLSKIK